MEYKVTLQSIFSTRKEELIQVLSDLSLPKDSQKVQRIVSDYLNMLFENEGTYRQSLTQSEDYILQAAMNLLCAQQSIASEITKKRIEARVDSMPQSNDSTSSVKTEVLKKEQFPVALGGTAIGGAAGAFVLGTWGAVFGAIAGTAVALYFSSQQIQSNKQTVGSKPRVDIVNQKIDVDAFVNIVENICQSVDTLIGTFRSQINRVVDKYESIEKPTLESDYIELIENIQSLLGAYSMDRSNENRSKRIEQRILLLSECLENFDLQAINYDGVNKDLFTFQPSPNVSEETMVLPAICKSGRIVIKGKVFIKQ